MSLVLNSIGCGADAANTGVNACDLHLFVEGAIQVPSTKLFTDAEVADIEATLQAGVINDNKSFRLYPLPIFTKIDPKGGEPNKVTYDNGEEVITWENDYSMEMEFYRGGLCLNNALRTRNGETVYLLFYGQGKLYGKNVNGKLAGIPGKNFWAAAAKPGAFKTAPVYKIMVNIAAKNLNDYVAVVALPDGFDMAGLTGLMDLSLNVTTPLDAAGLIIADIKESCYGTNYAELYETELATAGLILAKNTATGATLTITSTAVINGKLNITLNTSDADYPAIGGKITIYGAAPSVWAAAGIANVELASLTVTRTV
jgi:hypothetical protein